VHNPAQLLPVRLRSDRFAPKLGPSAIGAFDPERAVFPDKGAQPRVSQFVRAGAQGSLGVFL